MGAKASKRQTSAAKSTQDRQLPQLEAWSKGDVSEWLRVHDLVDCEPLVGCLGIDGDILTELYADAFAGVIEPHLGAICALVGAPLPSAQQLSRLHAALDSHAREAAAWWDRSMPKEVHTPASVAATKGWEPHPLTQDEARMVRVYHRVTANTESGGARTLPRVWELQPRTIRRYIGAPVLPLLAGGDVVPGVDACAGPKSLRSMLPLRDAVSAHASPAAPLNLVTVSQLCFHSFALSARKDGSRLRLQPRSAWTKRCNASSGGLHPEECYAFLPLHLWTDHGVTAGVGDAAVVHYSVRNHGVEVRRVIPAVRWAQWMRAMPGGCFPVLLSLASLRETWKYGERGWRYAHLDAGHALASLRFAATMLGWRFVTVPGVPDADVEAAFGLNQPRLAPSVGDDLHGDDPTLPFEGEEVTVVGVMFPSGDGAEDPSQGLPSLACMQAALCSLFAPGLAGEDAVWYGQRNRLSHSPVDWPIVRHMIHLSHGSTPVVAAGAPRWPALRMDHPAWTGPNGAPEAPELTVEQVARRIRLRRSALDYESRPMSGPTLWALLARLCPGVCSVPFRDNHWSSVQLVPIVVLFVLRVDDWRPGMYALARSPEAMQGWRGRAFERPPSGKFDPGADRDARWVWSVVDSSPLPLLRLQEVDGEPGSEVAMAHEWAELVGKASSEASCYQQIASTSCVTLGFVCDLEHVGADASPARAYRRAHWDAGSMGQWLYAEAEMQSLKATGMGCYLDPLVASWFGLGDRWAPLYHFAVGQGTNDSRYIPYAYETDMFAAAQ